MLVQDLAPDPAGSETFSFQQSSVEIPSELVSVELPTIQNEFLVSPESDPDTEDQDSSCGDIVQPLRRSDHVLVPTKRLRLKYTIFSWEGCCK